MEGATITTFSPMAWLDYVPPKGRIDPALDMRTPPPAQIDAMNAATYFARFAELLKDNPPGPFDYPIIHRLERVGFKPGQSFDLNTVPANVKQAFERGAADGNTLVVASSAAVRLRSSASSSTINAVRRFECETVQLEMWVGREHQLETAALKIALASPLCGSQFESCSA